jgi:putative protease
MPKKPEVMSPAGYWPQLRAAIEAGADAVYFGLKHFSARAKVGFDLDELPEVMRTLHARGVRGYLTFNTLVFEHELPEAARTIAAVAQCGVDALIVQDVGILRLARQIAPTLELHASTQMSITDSEGVRFARALGVDRVTLARELSLKEIRAIHDQTGVELEMFVHGALCVAYSGQCFSSEAWGGRSANRGQCAQACRLPYDLMVDGEHQPLADARYLLSPGDLCTVNEVEQIIAAGAGALKIEGRYKDSDYVALTTNAYRKAVDEAWAGHAAPLKPDEQLRLEQVYSRGLGAHFVNGTNHQTVVNGRAPRHRGVLIGRVTGVTSDSVVIAAEAAHRIAPLKPGDGVVFDAADWRSPEEPEEGGRVYELTTRRDRAVEVRFANGALQLGRIRPGDLVWRTHDPALAHYTRAFLEPAAPVQKQPVSVKATAREGEPLITVWTLPGGQCVEVQSEGLLSTARNRALSIEQLRDQFGRLGNTPYELAELTLDSEGAPFAPVSLQNEVRRRAVERLVEMQERRPALEVRDPAACLAALLPAQPAMPDMGADAGPAQLHLLVRTPEQLDAALQLAPASITLDYLDLYGLRPSIERVKRSGITTRVASPRVLKPGEARIVDFLVSLDCQILVRSTGILHALAGKASRCLIGDFSLNAANSIAAHQFLQLGLSKVTPTHDLNAAQVADLARCIGGLQIEAIAYQHLPVFHTEHCVFCRFLSTGTSYLDCGRPCEKHRIELRDHSGRRHPVMADVGCRNTVFGAEAQEASAHLERWMQAGIRDFRLEFAHESGSEVEEITKAFRNPSQLARRLKSIAPGGATQGSLQIKANYLELPILQ